MDEPENLERVGVYLQPHNPQTYEPQLLCSPNRDNIYSVAPPNNLLAMKILGNYQFNNTNPPFQNLNNALKPYGLDPNSNQFNTSTYARNFFRMHGARVEVNDLVRYFQVYFVICFGGSNTEAVLLCIYTGEDETDHEMGLCVEFKTLNLYINPLKLRKNSRSATFGNITYEMRAVYKANPEIASAYMQLFSIARPTTVITYGLNQIGGPNAGLDAAGLDEFKGFGNLGGRKRRKTKKRRHSRRY